MPWRARALTVALAALGALAGCGLGPGRSPTDVQLTVTREFGARALLSAHAPRVRGEETIMSLLARNGTIATRYGGGFVQSIDGLSGGHRDGDPVDWFYYVNGVQASRGAAETIVHPGDRVWWDWHDWSQAEEVPAVVGSFPEPFLNGVQGKRLPVRMECSRASQRACQTALGRLRARGVPVGLAALSGAYSPHVLRVIVGPFAAISGDPAAHRLEQGPAASGVYGRFAANGKTLTALDARGHATRTLGAGTGMVAATRYGQDAPVWLITGTDAQGTLLAARTLEEASLHDLFAIVRTSSLTMGLPEQGALAEQRALPQQGALAKHGP